MANASPFQVVSKRQNIVLVIAFLKNTFIDLQTSTGFMNGFIKYFEIFKKYCNNDRSVQYTFSLKININKQLQIGQGIQELDRVRFVEDSLSKI